MGPRDPPDGLTPAAFEARAPGFLGPGIFAPGGVFCPPPVPQDPDDRRFANAGAPLGFSTPRRVPSEPPFVVTGAPGLDMLPRPGAGRPAPGGAELGPLPVRLAGVLLNAFDSSWYHLALDHDPPVPDRPPVTVAFTTSFASTIGVRAGVRRSAPPGRLGFVYTFKWHAAELLVVGLRRPVATTAGAGPSGAVPAGTVPVPA
jgi:hypothetical protein